jgi:hypothetical protein
MLSTDFRILRLKHDSQIPLLLKYAFWHLHAHCDVLVHSAFRGRRESGHSTHFSFSKAVHAAHICPFVLAQTFFKDVLQLRQRASDR